MINFNKIAIILAITFLAINPVFAQVSYTSKDIIDDIGNSFGELIADLDGDGDLDVYSTTTTGQNLLWINDGAANFTAKNIAGDLGKSRRPIAVDIDNDGDLDIYTTNFTNEQNQLWINDGAANFTSKNIIGDLGKTRGVTSGDFDGDGDLDIYSANDTQNKLWINDGMTNFTSKDVVGDINKSAHVVSGDLDGDGDLDIYVMNHDGAGSLIGQNNSIWINDGNANFTSKDIVGDLGDSIGGELADLDGDGDLDIYVAINLDQQNKLWINDGNANFTSKDIVGDLGDSRDVVIKDLDGDGYLDIYVVNLNQNDTIWKNDGLANFTLYDSLADNGASRSGSIGDLDGDSYLDIYISGQTQHRLLINDYVEPVKEKKKRSSIKYTCKDFTASNYDAFGRHKASKCEYSTTTPVVTPTESNPLGGEQCSTDKLIHNKMKNGDTNGKYSSYNKGTITEVSLLQSHINRILADQYTNAAGPVDIWFGTKTQEGVKRLQRKLNSLNTTLNLDVDGVVGPYTIEAINMSC